MTQMDLFPLRFSFRNFVEKCVENDNHLSIAVNNANMTAIKRANITAKKKPALKKSSIFKSAEGAKVPITGEILTRFLDKNPADFSEFKDLFIVTPKPKLDKRDERVMMLVEKLVPIAAEMDEEEAEKKPAAKSTPSTSSGSEVEEEGEKKPAAKSTTSTSSTSEVLQEAVSQPEKTGRKRTFTSAELKAKGIVPGSASVQENRRQLILQGSSSMIGSVARASDDGLSDDNGVGASPPPKRPRIEDQNSEQERFVCHLYDIGNGSDLVDDEAQEVNGDDEDDDDDDNDDDDDEYAEDEVEFDGDDDGNEPQSEDVNAFDDDDDEDTEDEDCD